VSDLVKNFHFTMADADDTAQHRLDAAWEAAKEECKANTNNNMTTSSLLGDDGCSPLTASLDNDASAPPQLNGSSITPYYYEDPFLLPPSNETSPTTLLHRYRTFLQKHEPLLSLVEMIMERFVFYGHLFKASSHHDFDDGEGGIIRTEMYYATWNVIRWINDVVLVGVGGGMGMTVGTREEWLHQPLSNSLSHNNNSNKVKNKNKLWLSLHQLITSKLEILIPIIRATLTATTCIYPAIEALSRRSNNSNTNGMGNDADGEIISRRYRAALVSYRLERVRFMGRLALLMISWWAKLQRKRQQQRQQQQQYLSQKGESNTFVPSLLQRGGELDPYERMVPLQDAEDEARVVQYVGRRTGRRSVSNAGTTIISTPPQQQLGLSAVALTNFLPFIITKATNVIEYISKVLSSSGGNKLVYVYAVGEILHILRPLYWSRAECEEWQRRRILLLSRQQQQQQRGGLLSNSWSIWKAWWVSLLMDLISDKLLRLTSGGGGDAAAATMNNLRGGRRGSTFMGRRGGKQSAQNHQSYSSSSPSSAEEAKLAELEWRRSRHGLYLLRSPMYDVVTRPLASFIARVVSMIPPMGLGRWAAEYVLDMMSYWNSNHFMLES
jgi:hypothetical protein